MEIRSGTALRVVAIVFGVLIALRFLWIAHAIFFITFLGIVFGLAVSRAADWLEAHRVRRGIGAPATMFAAIVLIVALTALVAPSVTTETGDMRRELPQALKTLEQKFGGAPIADHAIALIGKELRGLARFLFPMISGIVGAVGGVIIVLFIAIYVAVEPGVYRAGALHLVPHRHRARAEEVVGALCDTLRQWLVARLMAMAAVGLITGLGLFALGVKGAAALGLFAGLLELIPFFGPFVSAIPALGIALADSPQKALGVLLLYVAVQQLEGNLITPLILERRLDVPPVLTIVAVSAMGVVFGVLGMLVAEPILAATLVVTKMLYVQDVVHDDV